ncbi:MAG: UDP-N-acetylglucosamine--N-acetylmuramyl-(pentapeptide) pyrophosphoryl-undecaprenol N-acetylglucosamine transferase [Verrucomicrobia bacterium]|nr:UDP-N-acetylglucosamine--N-acetylmuramyl-(pentapeptide) pyrophosphoryl-undecaprenol N-acetylglucosamine transferase [Verrucomicrobiota bacterium]
MPNPPAKSFVAIACGGTGGHLFPGIAVAAELRARGADSALLISQKEVDQQAAGTAPELEAVPLPAVGFNWRHPFRFLSSANKSYRAAKEFFSKRPPQAVLAMGGFTSVPAVFAGKKFGAKIFLHESNAIPGRANRWLAHVADEAFVGYESATLSLPLRRVTLTGTPVREQFHRQDAASCLIALGLDPKRPMLLVMGGSHGARGVNDFVLAALPELIARVPDLQFLHLTGAGEDMKVRDACAKLNLRAVVKPFLTEMELAMSAATVAVSRAGASTIAEIAAMRLPAVLVPYPHATDNHQWFNGRAVERSGAARMLWTHHDRPEDLVRLVTELLTQPAARDEMSTALARWHHPDAAARIAGRILAVIGHGEPDVNERRARETSSSETNVDLRETIAAYTP